MRLILFTNDSVVAAVADSAGVDWILVDLESNGKAQRQFGHETPINTHTLDDIKSLRRIVRNGKLVVRINPIGNHSYEEIRSVLALSPDIVMLPFFKTKEAVTLFFELVRGRSDICLLFETNESLELLTEILSEYRADFLHVGLNDLKIQRKMPHVFTFLADGSMDIFANTVKPFGIPFGFGGISRIGTEIPPAENILLEHARLGSTGVILSRSFFRGIDSLDRNKFSSFMMDNVSKIREFQREMYCTSVERLNDNMKYVRNFYNYS